jgi:pyruvate dehydrogenase E1 component alpha subunit
MSAGVLSAEDLSAVQAKVAAEIAAALKFAQESPEPDVSELFEGLYV